MQEYTGWEYLLIDLANHAGRDKDLFEERIQWATDNLDNLEDLIQGADEPALYEKAVMDVRKVLNGEPTGHRVSLDAVCSGLQVMSALTGCETGANATGLVDPNRRADAYTDVTAAMRKILVNMTDVSRDDAKDATMHSLYGSIKSPKDIFGDGTEAHKGFYKALAQVAPGALELLEDLRNSWQPFALNHAWTLPDGFDAKVNVLQKVEARIEVDELDHASFAYEYYVNEGTESGLSNIANCVHSVDGYVLRSLVRRCDYDPAIIGWAAGYIEMLLLERHLGTSVESSDDWLDEDFLRLRDRYTATQMPDIRILDYAQEFELRAMSTAHLKGLAGIVNMMLEHKPFHVLTVHDDFSCLPNNVNHMRKHYREIFAQMAESTILDDILSQLYGVQGTFPKKSNTLATKIRKSAYAIC